MYCIMYQFSNIYQFITPVSMFGYHSLPLRTAFVFIKGGFGHGCSYYCVATVGIGTKTDLGVVHSDGITTALWLPELHYGSGCGTPQT